jgi:hypothetical protein
MNAAMKLGLPSALLLIAGGLLAYAPTASAQQATQLKTVNGRCLQERSDLIIFANGCLATGLQLWHQVQVGTKYQLRNAVTGRCIAILPQGLPYAVTCSSGSTIQLFTRVNVTSSSARFGINGQYLQGTTTSQVIIRPLSTNRLQVWEY